MIPLDSSLDEYRESISVPTINWQVILLIPDPTDSESTLQIDVSERLMNDPGIVDSADYRENLTYTNEINLKLRNDDNYLSNDSGSGVLDDISKEIECYVYGYYDIPNGIDHKIKNFGGYLSLKRLKPDRVKKYLQVPAVAYFGKAETLNGYNVTTKYIDEKGLRLYTTQLWITDAAVVGKELLKGVHKIYSILDGGNPKGKLDDGEWEDLTFEDETTLSNSDDSQRVIVYYEGFTFAFDEEQESTVIVKSVGQYPETFFYYPPISEAISKCFSEIGITNKYIERFEFDTYDGRKIISGSSRVDNTNNTFIPIAIVSNGDDKIYISGSMSSLVPFKNQIWEYNYATNSIRLIYETGLNDNTKYKLIWDSQSEVLLAFIDNKEEDSERGFIQKFTITELGSSYQTLLEDNQFDSVNPYYRFHYSPFLQKLIFIGLDGGNKKIFELDLNGNKTAIETDNGIEMDGASWVYDKNTVVEFYYVKNVAGTRKLYKKSYSNGWQAASFVIDWFDNADYNNWLPYQFSYEEKIFLTKFDKTRFYNRTGNTFTANLNPANVKIYSPFEFNNKLYVMTNNDVNSIQKVAYFSNNTLNYESDDINPYDIVETIAPPSYGFQQICKFIDISSAETLAILSRFPALLLRFSSKVVPFIKGEYDTSDQSIREILQELSNNFLGFIKVDMNKKGWFVRRSSYKNVGEFIPKKDYIKHRSRETVYNEAYERVEVENVREVKGYYGDTSINAKALQLRLRLIPDDFVKDIAKYMHDYYSVVRHRMHIKYLPTFFNHESLDNVNLSALGIVNSGKIHKHSPGKEDLEMEVVYVAV